jgi:hypothetical protein
MEGIWIVFFPVVIIGGLFLFFMWSNQKMRIGTIRCRRCNHVGPPKGLWVPFRGVKPVCQKCHSDDWVTVDTPSK